MVKRGNETEQYCVETEIPDFEIDAIARCLLPKIQAYFDSPEGQVAFEEWKQSRK